MMVNLNKESKIPGSDSFFQEVLNSVGIGIISLNSNQSIKLVNLETLNIFGYKQEEIENNNYINGRVGKIIINEKYSKNNACCFIDRPWWIRKVRIQN